MFSFDFSLFVDSVLIFVLAFLIDVVFGEYPDRIHPTIGIGKIIILPQTKTKNPNPRIEKANGVLLALIIMLIVALPVFLLLFWLSNPALRRNTLHYCGRNLVQSNFRHQRHGAIHQTHRKSTEKERFG